MTSEVLNSKNFLYGKDFTRDPSYLGPQDLHLNPGTFIQRYKIYTSLIVPDGY